MTTLQNYKWMGEGNMSWKAVGLVKKLVYKAVKYN